MNDHDRLYRLHADRLAGVCLRRDEALRGIDAEYRAESETVGANPDSLYAAYRSKRGSASAEYETEIDEVHQDYRSVAGENAVPLPVPAREPELIVNPPTSRDNVPTSPHTTAQHFWPNSGPLPKTPNRGLVQLRRGGIALLAAIAIVAAVSFVTPWFSSSASVVTKASTPVAAPVLVVLYEVEGTAKSADITYQRPNGTAQQTGVDVPLKVKSQATHGIRLDMQPGDFLYISAQNNGDSGTITCRITVDGVVVAENTSRGGYAIASCSWRK